VRTFRASNSVQVTNALRRNSLMTYHWVVYFLGPDDGVPDICCACSWIQDAFDFLRTLEELEGKIVTLRNAVNTITVDPGQTQTFVVLGISGSTALIVVEREEETPVEEARPSPRRKGSDSVAVRSSPRRIHSIVSGDSAEAGGRATHSTSGNGSSSSSSSGGASGKQSSAAPLAPEVVSLITPKHSRKRGADDFAVIDLTS
jgi:hypothetical protein